jgi:hypothetical protein
VTGRATRVSKFFWVLFFLFDLKKIAKIKHSGKKL